MPGIHALWGQREELQHWGCLRAQEAGPPLAKLVLMPEALFLLQSGGTGMGMGEGKPFPLPCVWGPSWLPTLCPCDLWVSLSC